MKPFNTMMGLHESLDCEGVTGDVGCREICTERYAPLTLKLRINTQNTIWTSTYH